MNSWKEDLLNMLLIPATTAEAVFDRIKQAAQQLGFEHVAFGFQTPYPVTNPNVTLLNNYPTAWQQRYAQAGYLLTDPTVDHGRQSQTPIVWNDQAFASNRALWADAQDHGIKTGWAQSCLERSGAGSLLTLCRCTEPLTASELQAKETSMRWLVQVAHLSLSRAIFAQVNPACTALTKREREVLQWSADGKSAQDIADTLNLSKSVIDFHLKNSIQKLNASNKTAAVARAALMGWLS
jgi:DNA-binding CsgD family transcriptional regulator